jgi:putative hydrolase of the HAD superfamily
MIQAIVFDADGVLVRPKSWFVTGAFERYGVPKEEFMAFIRGDFKRCTTGELNLEAALPPLLERWRVPVSVAEFIQAWLEHENVVDSGMLEEVSLLRTWGLPCFVGTNQERNRANFMRFEMGLQLSTDGVFASSDLGARKPQRAFFDRLFERLAEQLEEHLAEHWAAQRSERRGEQHPPLEPVSLLLVDDSPENVAAARAAGWCAEHFTTRDAFRQRLASYLK